MKKLKHKIATVRLNNSSVVIYYTYQKVEMRYPTGIHIYGERDKDGNYIDWDYKNKRLKIPKSNSLNKTNAIKQLESKQKIIDDLLNRANSFINEYFIRGSIIYPQNLENLLKRKEEQKQVVANANFFECYQQFLIRKRDHFNARGKIISIKDYNSTLNLLLDFEKYKRYDMRIEYVNTLWLEDFVNYMALKRPGYYGDYKVKTDGELKNQTIRKRLSILAEFYSYLKELKLIGGEAEEMIRKVRKGVPVIPTRKETLDIQEIHQFYKFKFENKSDEQIRDLFVFLCLTGIRFQDLVEFDKKFIRKRKEGDGYTYLKAASKTSLDYNIPLCKIVLEILAKYEFKLPVITSQHGNRAVKEALKIAGLLDEYTQLIHKKTGEYKKRYEAITLHKGRDSFITNLVDSTPLNELMKYTGHKKLSTLQGYIDKKRPVNMDYVKIFDIT
jgi:site-specific recombinase XerD